MAGDWIKVESVTPDKPEVHQIASMLGLDPDAVVGKLIRLWIWADQQTITGNADRVTLSLLDRIANARGFGEAMQFAGWLTIIDTGLVFPNFDRHNGKTAKIRALTKKRVDSFRNAPSVTVALPEKRREEINTPLPPKGGESGRFQEFWNAYPKGTNRQQALREWERLSLDDAEVASILRILACQVANDPQWQREGGRYIPNAAKWLQDRQWEKTTASNGKTAAQIAADSKRKASNGR